MGFGPEGVWVMGYCGLMGYGVQIPANQVGGLKMLWYFKVYGLSKVWVMGVLTVISYSAQSHALQCSWEISKEYCVRRLH